MSKKTLGRSTSEREFRISDVGNGQFALIDHLHNNGPHVFVDYNSGGILSINPNQINDWWKFAIE